MSYGPSLGIDEAVQNQFCLLNEFDLCCGCVLVSVVVVNVVRL